MTTQEKMTKICENEKAVALADKILSDIRERNLNTTFAEVVDYVYGRYCK